MINNRIRKRHTLKISRNGQKQNDFVRLMLFASALVIVTIWSYWPIIVDLFKEWQRNDDYSAGQLVPLIAVFLVWHKRKELRKCFLTPCWWGIALLVLAYLGRSYGLLFMYESAQRYSLVLTIAGLVLLVAGWQVFRTLSWILLFLFLMVPFPGRVHNLISGPLQRAATTGSVFLLEAFGVNVSQNGNVVTLNEQTTMAVEEACSGLRMLTAFIIIAGFIAFMVKRSRTQKAIVFLSSIPVAVMCNIIRLCITAILFIHVNAEIAEKFFHDFAGFCMMPAAVLLIFGLLWLMDKIIIAEPDKKGT
jgi:exosortase